MGLRLFRICVRNRTVVYTLSYLGRQRRFSCTNWVKNANIPMSALVAALTLRLVAFSGQDQFRKHYMSRCIVATLYSCGSSDYSKGHVFRLTVARVQSASIR